MFFLADARVVASEKEINSPRYKKVLVTVVTVNAFVNVNNSK